jgi:RNA polymerase sigma-70 factor (ECF subfamily)
MARMNLIERILSGDPNAFELIFDQYKNLVYRTAYLILENSNEAEDALQETFLKAYRYLETYQPSRGAFSTWLYRITVTHFLRQRRKLSRIFKPLETYDDEFKQFHPSHEDKISEEQAVLQTINRLSNKLRIVIILRYFLDLSYLEITQVLDVPLGTVKSRLNLALKNVRNELIAEKLGAFPVHEESE